MRRKSDWHEAGREPAPGELYLLQDFVNTLDHETGVDELASPRAASEWLARHGLWAGDESVPVPALETADLERVTALREGLRALLWVHNGGRRPETAESLDRAVSGALLRVRFGAGGESRLEPVVAGIDGALARLVGIFVSARDSDPWRRLKACKNLACRRAYYDLSPNRSRVWCSRRRCGGRLHAAEARRREKWRQRGR